MKSRLPLTSPVRSTTSSAPAASASATWRASEPSTYSSDWPGPAWLNGRIRTTRMPWASAYCAPSRSQAAFDTA